jgi:chromosome partitioning protein
VIAREIAAALADHEPPVLTSRIGQRVIFADAARTGRLAGELEQAGPATREIMSLAAEVWRIAR